MASNSSYACDSTRITPQTSFWYQLPEAGRGEAFGQHMSGIPFRVSQLGQHQPSLKGLMSPPWLHGHSKTAHKPGALVYFLDLVSHSLHAVTQWHFLFPLSFSEKTNANLFRFQGVSLPSFCEGLALSVGFLDAILMSVVKLLSLVAKT